MKRKYTIQINVDAYLKLDVFASSENEAVNMAENMFTDMPTDKIRAMLDDVDLIRETFIDECEPCEVEIGGKIWRVIDGTHIPQTPLRGFSETHDIAQEDWKVMDIAEGELWMNNCAGYAYIISNGVTYARFF